MKISIKVSVSGRVQGVFYRDSTRRKANEFSVTGWVKNLEDGRVEALLSGDKKNVEALIDWMKVGPPAAQVTHVKIENIEPIDFPSFDIV